MRVVTELEKQNVLDQSIYIMKGWAEETPRGELADCLNSPKRSFDEREGLPILGQAVFRPDTGKKTRKTGAIPRTIIYPIDNNTGALDLFGFPVSLGRPSDAGSVTMLGFQNFKVRSYTDNFESYVESLLKLGIPEAGTVLKQCKYSFQESFFLTEERRNGEIPPKNDSCCILL